MRGAEPAARSDFDDDGFQDLAIGAPGASVVTTGGTILGAGIVYVLYGTADGLSTARAQAWHQDVPGIAFGPGTDDHFGSALAAGDFDKDGVADLAIGVPGENRFIGGAIRSNAGLVEVIYGTDGVGLTATGDDAIAPTSSQFPTETSSLRWVDSDFGATLVTLDRYDTVAPVDQAPDGFADLAIGAPGFDDDIGLWVALAGQEIATNPTFREFVPFRDLIFTEGSRSASSLAAGSFDGDGFDELAVGCPSCDVVDGDETTGLAGMFTVFSREVNLQFLIEDFQGNPSAREPHDFFGRALAAGDFDDDGVEELAVGVPGKSVDGHLFAGQVQIYTGKIDQGLGGPVRIVDEGADAVPSEPVALERFGQSLAVGDFGRGVGVDLAVGALRERVGSVAGAGGAFVLYNTGTGLSAIDSQRWTQNTSGVLNASETNDSFGGSLMAGQFSRGGTHDLVIGVDLEDVGSGASAHANAGLVHVIYGKSTGLTAADDQVFTIAATGLPGASDDAGFGAALR